MRRMKYYTRDPSSRMRGSMNWIQVLSEIRTVRGRSLFVRSGNTEFSELGDGIYRLKFEFKREIGSDAPILKRFGFTHAEEAGIEFSLPCFLPAAAGMSSGVRLVTRPSFVTTP